jgi:L-aminopeptidase/D-esterase-like protein
MSEPLPLPDGFSVGHWTDAGGRTGCTVVMPPAGTRGAVDVRGGGTGTRDTEALGLLADAEGPTAVLLTGGSAFGLAATDGVMRWLEERGQGRPTLVGPVPLVPTAVIFDLAPGGARPGPEAGYAACQAARRGIPRRGPVGAGAGTAVCKALGRERATRGGVGYAAGELPGGTRVAVLAVANAAGDVVAADGELIAAPRALTGALLRSAELIPTLDATRGWPAPSEQNTTLVCVCTDAAIDKRGCGIVARMASAGLARAVDPAFSPLDGDVVFCLACGPTPFLAPGPSGTLELTALGTVAATVTAAAIRDAVLASQHAIG